MCIRDRPLPERVDRLRIAARDDLDRPDGTVEVVASGDAQSVDALGQWLWTGSPPSRVADVRREPAEELPIGARFDVA